MRIFEFISVYCSDLVEQHKQEKSLIDLSEFAHDAVITDAEGVQIPVVCVDNLDIPVSDFLTMDKADFTNAWRSPGCAEAYDNYISALEILEGEDALSRIRKAILAERDRLSADVELVTEL
ncbi:MAG: hypothetical protein NC548_31495 [Lachnospiraceae bacterium]|nr:hypothetical protein [Lachnospiraceae bacterium]